MLVKFVLPLILLSFASSAFADQAEQLTKTIECHSIKGAQKSISLRASMNGDNEDNAASATLALNRTRGAINKDTPCNDENFSLTTDFEKQDFSIEADISTDDTTSMSVSVEALPGTIVFSDKANAESGFAHFDGKLSGDVSKYKGTQISVSDVQVKCTATWQSAQK